MPNESQAYRGAMKAVNLLRPAIWKTRNFIATLCHLVLYSQELAKCVYTFMLNSASQPLHLHYGLSQWVGLPSFAHKPAIIMRR